MYIKSNTPKTGKHALMLERAIYSLDTVSVYKFGKEKALSPPTSMEGEV